MACFLYACLPGPLLQSEADPGVVTVDPGVALLRAEADADLLPLLFFLTGASKYL